MFSESFYLNSVNEVYRVILKSAKFTIIEKNDLQEVRQKNVTVTRIVPVLKKIWESHKAEGWGSFDKVAVCEKICAEILRSGKVEEQFAAGFQRLFERIGS